MWVATDCRSKHWVVVLKILESTVLLIILEAKTYKFKQFTLMFSRTCPIFVLKYHRLVNTHAFQASIVQSTILVHLKHLNNESTFRYTGDYLSVPCYENGGLC
jgi:hypothetical protein